jgi:DNA-binding transcriptional MerR regulator
MPRNRSSDKNDNKPGLRMNELSRATGVPKSTILHYLNEGLLPEPVKTSRNMAYYADDCIDRVRFIQDLKRRHRLSLAEIRQVLGSKEGDLGVYVGLNEIVFGNHPADTALGRQAFCEETGLTDSQVTELLSERLLLPLDPDRFDSDDVSAGIMFAAAFANGIQMKDLTYYVSLGEKIVDHEMALRNKLTHHLPYEEDAAFTMEMVKRARMSRAYIIDRLFQHRVAAMPDLKETD